MSSICAVGFDERRIDAIFAPFDQCHLPGVAVGIAVRGRPMYRKGFGLASMELPVVLSPSIRMRIGSTSKHFASFACLLLCEEGRAHIDDAVGRYLPELPALVGRLTLRQLMGHVGGLRDVFDITWQFCGTDKFITSEELLAMYRSVDDVNAPPGATWIYSNGGYLLLSLAVERIGKGSFEDILRERIFEPIGMYDTLVRRFERGFVANSATLHMLEPGGGYERSPFFGTAFLGEGGIASTVDDMLRWMAHMDAPRIGKSVTWQALREPLTLDNGVSTGYGLGLFAGRYRGMQTLHHPGGGMGGTAQMLKVPAAGLDVVVMANRSDASPMELVERILDACLAGLKPAAPPFAGPFVSGLFRSAKSGRVIQLFERGGGQIAAIDGMQMQVEPDERGVLRPIGAFAYAKHSLTTSGNAARPDAIRFDDYGNIDELMREAPPASVDVDAIVGRYRSDSVRTQSTICATAAGPRWITAGPFGSVEYRLECLADGIWRALPTRATLGGVLVFDRDRRMFRFSCHRTWALPFQRID